MQFWATEVSAPSWNHRVEHGGDPDAFCRIERLAYPDRQAFVLAVRRKLAGSVAAAADALLDAIAAAMQEPRRAVFDRSDRAIREMARAGARADEIAQILGAKAGLLIGGAEAMSKRVDSWLVLAEVLGYDEEEILDGPLPPR